VGLLEIRPAAGSSAAVRSVATAGLVVGAWALVPPYLGPVLVTKSSAEFADHVLPGLAVLLISSGCLVASHRLDPTLGFLAGLGVVLAGFWMTATHVPLVLEAFRDVVPWLTAAHHTIPGLVVLGVGAVWSARFWGDEQTGSKPHVPLVECD